MVNFIGKVAELGVWLADVSQESINELVEYIFSNNKNIQTINYRNSLIAYDNASIENHFRITLPHKIEEFELLGTAKSRYNIRRQKKFLSEDFNGYIVNEYTNETVPENIMSEFFKMKKQTHKRNFRLSGRDFIERYSITNIYTLSICEKIIAVILSCNQCSIAYISNITYDTEYKKYSPGIILYDIYLKKLAEAGINELFLGGGGLEYKRRYGSIEETTYSGVFYRNYKAKLRFKAVILIQKIIYKLNDFYKKYMPRYLKNFYRKFTFSEKIAAWTENWITWTPWITWPA